MGETGLRGPFTQRIAQESFCMSAAAPAQTQAEPQAQQTPNNLLIAILSAFIFFPLGALALVNAAKVNKLSAEGKADEAQKASADAKKYAYFAIIIGVTLTVLAFTVKVATGN